VAGGAVAFGDVGRSVRGEPAAGADEGIRRHAPERSRRGPGAKCSSPPGRAEEHAVHADLRVGHRRSAPGTLRARRTPASESTTPPKHRRHLTAVTFRRGRTGSRSRIRVMTTEALASAQGAAPRPRLQ
jgi:hypothetical protein